MANHIQLFRPSGFKVGSPVTTPSLPRLLPASQRLKARVSPFPFKMRLSSGLMTKDGLSCFVVAVMEYPEEGNSSETGIISASGSGYRSLVEGKSRQQGPEVAWRIGSTARAQRRMKEGASQLCFSIGTLQGLARDWLPHRVDRHPSFNAVKTISHGPRSLA